MEDKSIEGLHTTHEQRQEEEIPISRKTSYEGPYGFTEPQQGSHGSSHSGTYEKLMRAERPAAPPKIISGATRHTSLGPTALLLTASQMACIAIIACYELYHENPTGGRFDSSPSSTCTSTTGISSLDPITTTLPCSLHVSQSTFVLSTLAFGVVAAKQYELHRHDHYQRACLGIGVLAGIGLCIPTFVSPDVQRIIVLPLAIGIMCALNGSALGHWLARMTSRQEVQVGDII